MNAKIITFAYSTSLDNLVMEENILTWTVRSKLRSAVILWSHFHAFNNSMSFEHNWFCAMLLIFVTIWSRNWNTFWTNLLKCWQSAMRCILCFCVYLFHFGHFIDVSSAWQPSSMSNQYPEPIGATILSHVAWWSQGNTCHFSVVIAYHVHIMNTWHWKHDRTKHILDVSLTWNLKLIIVSFIYWNRIGSFCCECRYLIMVVSKAISVLWTLRWFQLFIEMFAMVSGTVTISRNYSNHE